MRILLIQITTVLLISYAKRTSGRHLPSTVDVDGEEESVPSQFDIDDDSKTDESKEDPSEDKLPILPPLILLDFGNDTEDSNVTSEEKSKRTVNSGLGYGLENNALQPRRYNYYFPGGKSGTTVSIEESISPFLPKTIVERVQASSQRNYLDSRQNSFVSSTDRYSNLQQTKSQSVFGQRTKPQKVAGASSYESYQNVATTAKPSADSFPVQNSGYRNAGISTQSPLSFSPSDSVRYVTPSPGNFASHHSNSFNYASTISPFSMNENGGTYAEQRLRSNVDSRGFPVSQTVDSSTVAPLSYDSHFSAAGSQLSNRPRYTVENGVRYENKIFWKYPDGRVSDVPPATYVEYTRSSAGQSGKSQQPHAIYEPTTTESSVLSQGPVQFPTVPEPAAQEPNPFVSGESLSSSLPQQQVYRLGYQSLVSQRQNINLARQRKPNSNAAASYSFSTSSSRRAKPGSNSAKVNYQAYQQPSRYMVNGPNPEYTDGYTTEATLNSTTPLSNLFSSSGDRSPRKYTSKVRNYLDNVLAEEDGSKKQSFDNNDLNSYSNLRYSDLLNYNPSISEYIRNPSSILNVRPTFVQAGNSLIPVIILRVDGASPIQTKSSQNINLKALLQQYLVQYAKSIQELAQPSTYDLGTESIGKGQTSGQGKSPVLDLIRLTQEDARQMPGYPTDSYIGRSSYETSNLEEPKQLSNGRYSSRQKVKNVQILDDPRFPTYRVKN
ncbi:uncharacterized protein LOC114874014 [Osmia bicornis bicornis]|uniref:uncharacterized protein LOC114874014 n=1 Tax=Osmia bicornis bicornis TaxID=1437191 RepID=UPI001EAF599D|nr:uncharacterized protein LOC114874014 [Osmia bicornis bicornis]